MSNSELLLDNFKTLSDLDNQVCDYYKEKGVWPSALLMTGDQRRKYINFLLRPRVFGIEIGELYSRLMFNGILIKRIIKKQDGFILVNVGLV